jgi:hypothetical protein
MKTSLEFFKKEKHELKVNGTYIIQEIHLTHIDKRVTYARI